MPLSDKKRKKEMPPGVGVGGWGGGGERLESNGEFAGKQGYAVS